MQGVMDREAGVMWKLRFTLDDQEGKVHERNIWLICSFTSAKKVRDYILLRLNGRKIRSGMRLNFPLEEYFEEGRLKRMFLFESMINHMILWKTVVLEEAANSDKYFKMKYRQMSKDHPDLTFQKFKSACLFNVQHLPQYYQEIDSKVNIRLREHWYVTHPSNYRFGRQWVYGLPPGCEASWTRQEMRCQINMTIFHRSSTELHEQFGTHLNWDLDNIDHFDQFKSFESL